MLQANALAGLDEVLTANAAEIRIVENEIAEFRALLDKVHLRKAPHLVVKAVETDEFAENHTGIVKTERLIEIACE